MADFLTRQCILVGNLNPAILVPAWVARHVLKEERPVETTVELMAGLPTLPFGGRFTARGLTWVPTPNRLEVLAHDADADPGEFIARVLDQLSHTPVRAVGSNFSVKLDRPADEHIKRLCRGPLDQLLARAGHVHRGYQSVIRFSHRDDAVLNVIFDTDAQPAELRFNFHRDVKTAVPDAVSAARRWVEDRAEAERLFAVIVGELVQ